MSEQVQNQSENQSQVSADNQTQTDAGNGNTAPTAPQTAEPKPEPSFGMITEGESGISLRTIKKAIRQ